MSRKNMSMTFLAVGLALASQAVWADGAKDGAHGKGKKDCKCSENECKCKDKKCKGGECKHGEEHKADEKPAEKH